MAAMPPPNDAAPIPGAAAELPAIVLASAVSAPPVKILIPPPTASTPVDVAALSSTALRVISTFPVPAMLIPAPLTWPAKVSVLPRIATWSRARSVALTWTPRAPPVSVRPRTVAVPAPLTSRTVALGAPSTIVARAPAGPLIVIALVIESAEPVWYVPAGTTISSAPKRPLASATAARNVHTPPAVAPIPLPGAMSTVSASR